MNRILEAAEIQLAYKSKVKASLRPKISSSRDAESILRKYWNDDLLELLEEFKIMLLNRYNKVIGIFTVSQGGIAGTVADPKLIFGCALKAFAERNIAQLFRKVLSKAIHYQKNHEP